MLITLNRERNSCWRVISVASIRELICCSSSSLHAPSCSATLLSSRHPMAERQWWFSSTEVFWKENVLNSNLNTLQNTTWIVSCGISGSYRNVCESHGLLGCDAMWSGKLVPKFQRNLMCLLPWRWRQQVKCWDLCTSLLGISYHISTEVEK